MGRIRRAARLLPMEDAPARLTSSIRHPEPRTMALTAEERREINHPNAEHATDRTLPREQPAQEVRARRGGRASPRSECITARGGGQQSSPNRRTGPTSAWRPVCAGGRPGGPMIHDLSPWPSQSTGHGGAADSPGRCNQLRPLRVRGWPPSPSVVCQNSLSGFGGIARCFFGCS
jgi:hypothetical protein